MNRGIYIVANDRVLDQSIALLNSIRLRDPETPIVLIPYDEQYDRVASVLAERHQVQLFPDLDLIESLSQKLHQIFGDRFFDKPNKLRKQACWLGPFDEFLYIDTDIIVFEKIIEVLNYFDRCDFLCADYQHRSGIQNIFSPIVQQQQIFTPAELQDVFNSGFWAAKKSLLSESDLYALCAECAAHPEYFDFSGKVSDQPILNYLVLKQIPRRLNLARQANPVPGNWAGSPHFVCQEDINQNDRLFDPQTGRSLQFLHWAGIRIEPGCPYWEIWKHYRCLNETPADPFAFQDDSTPFGRSSTPFGRSPQVKPHQQILQKLLQRLKP
ncbi:Npun_R2821/Npun_R2822 family protein [Leptolyngbya ohadii]|uniref:Npun_R2821/Npun_R2822 family protein n=1 Tax=Leptolyngbya ohadii TaxID=1962290 RepID=UPI0019D4817E|nr:Npun_R2821/Npun_R2822 family protein [Leptolyngbya ohadii]